MASKMSPIIAEIRNVSFTYNGRTVLQDVSLDIEAGDFIAMIGPNGGGKTTLLKLILGLLEPQRGVIRVLGRHPRRSSPQVGYVPQNVHLNRSFPITTLDVVLMGKLTGAMPWRGRSAVDRQDALAALDRLGVADLSEKRIGSLSGGQRQRAFIARALVTRPKLLLLDEPTASIDARGQAAFFRLLEELNRDVTILVVSHDLLAVSTHVKSVACVNRNLHYHHQAEITAEMMEGMYPCEEGEVCPVELLAHGLPHRVLKDHRKE